MPRPLILILVAYLALGLLYSAATPPFEASDELHHYPVVRHIALGNGLPVQPIGVETAWAQEGSQPPAYYLLAAALTFWVDTGDFDRVHQLNPFTRAGIPGTSHNPNYTRAPAELLGAPFPPRGTFLAVYLIRLLSLVMGAGTITFAYLLAQTLFPSAQFNSTLPALAAALTAFNPMFLFISASVNNDNLIWLLASAILFLLVRLLQTPNLRPQISIGLGLLLALAALTKISGLVLFPIAAIALVAVSRQPSAFSRQPTVVGRPSLVVGRWPPVLVRHSSFILQHSTFLFLPSLLLSSWWYLRNLSLYGELLGLARMVAIAGPRPPGFGLADLALEWRSFWYAYWGLFGSFSILAPQWVYIFFTVLTIAALFGLVLHSVKQRQAFANHSVASLAPHLLLLAFIGLTYISFLRWTLITPASQGRLVFTTLAPASAYLAFGLHRWLSSRRLTLLTAALALVALVTGLGIRPHYLPPAPLTEAQLPADLHRVHARLAPGVELVGYSLASVADNHLPVTLYWRALQPIAADHNLFLHVLGRDHALVGSLDTWPGGGLRPTSLWQPGPIYPDPYLIELDSDALRPTTLLLDIAMWADDPARPYPITTLSGDPIPSVLVEAGALPSPRPLPASPLHPAESTLEYGIQLLGYDLPSTLIAGQPADLSLYWQATETIPADFTVFVHVVDSGGHTVAQADGPPVGGYWPTTHWQAGHPVVDSRPITIPAPGAYRVRVGLYDPVTVIPLGAFRPDGSEWPDRAIELGTVTVK